MPRGRNLGGIQNRTNQGERKKSFGAMRCDAMRCDDAMGCCGGAAGGDEHGTALERGHAVAHEPEGVFGAGQHTHAPMPGDLT